VFAGHKKSNRVCNRIHQNRPISHLWKMHHIAWESHRNWYEITATAVFYSF
jgi:hypothetical protein